MKIIKDDNLSVTHRFLVYKHDNMFMLNALAAFSFDNPDAPLTDDVIWDGLAEACGDNIFDESIHKNVAEFMFRGAFHQPGGEPAPGGTLRVKVGDVEKSLHVFGDRYWIDRGKDPRFSDPALFIRMDVSWANAFGGAGHEYNRSGKGMDEVVAPGGHRLLPLPNIEDPGRPITSPHDRPEPAGLDMLGTMRFLRGRDMGTYDDLWLAKHWPYHAPDARFEGANQALRDQWLKGYFQGGEPVEIHHMHPREPVLKTRLPRLRVRFFIRRILRGTGQFGELPADFDTVWLLPERKLMICAWRTISLTPVHAARDVTHILAVHEPLDQPRRPDEAYYERLGIVERAPMLAPEEQPAPPASEPEPPQPELAEAEPPDAAEPSVPAAGLAGGSPGLSSPELDRTMEALQAEYKKLGVAYPPPAFKTPDPFGLEGLSPKEAVSKLESALEENQTALKAIYAKAGIDPSAYVFKEDPSTQDMLDALAGVQLTDPKAQEVVEETKKVLRGMLDEEEAAPAAEPLAPEIEPPPVLAAEPPQPPDSSLTREMAEQWAAQGKSMAGKDLTGLDLSGCNLAGAVFAGACLENAVLREADLSGADFSRALMAGAVLSSAKADKAVFAGAVGPKIQADGIALSGADLSGASFPESDFTGADLENADLTMANLESARLENAKAAGCRARLANFAGASAAGAVFSHGGLASARFDGARLSGADFTGAILQKAAFSDASGEKPCFAGANLAGSKASGGTNFKDADFSRAVLEDANWIDCDLPGADLSEARMDRAQLRSSRMEGATLRRAKARRAIFDQADLSKADLQGLDAFKASFREAVLVFADMRNANFYSVDFFMAKFHETRLADSLLGATILSKWRPVRID